jgi:hypothetical protein
MSKGKEDTKSDPNETLGMGCDAFLLAVYGVIQSLGTDERPEVRHSAIRTLFQSLSSHGHKLTLPMWKRCLWNLVFPLVDTVRHLVSRHVTSMQISDYVRFQIYRCSFCTRNWAGFFCSRRLSRGITGRMSTSLLIVFLFGFS